MTLSKYLEERKSEFTKETIEAYDLMCEDNDVCYTRAAVAFASKANVLYFIETLINGIEDGSIKLD